jgi:hypothetical protein
MPQPTAKPVTVSTMMAMTSVRRSASTRPERTAERAIGSDRKRSMRPVAMSVETPTAVPWAVPTRAIPNMPPMRYSW